MTHIPLCTDHTVTRNKTFTKPSPKRTNMKAREKPVNISYSESKSAIETEKSVKHVQR